MSDEGLQPPPVPRPVVELNYASVLSRKRPGLVTAVGVLSVVLGSIGMLTGAFNAISSGFFWFWALAGPALTAAGAAAAASGPFSPQEVQAIVQGLEAWTPIPDDREQMLTGFFSDRGLTVLPAAPRPLTQQTVQARVSGSTSDESGTISYTLPDGILEVGSAHVLWAPKTSGSAQSIVPEEVEAIVQAIGRVATAPPTVRQYATIRGVLSGKQNFVDIPARGTVSAQVVAAIARPGGPLTIFAQSGAVLYVPDALAETTADPFAADSTSIVIPSPPATVPTSATGATTLPATAPLAISAASAAIAFFAALGNLALAIFLLVIGIQVFRLSRRGRRMHLLYAGLKLLLTVIAAAAWSSMLSGMLGGAGVQRIAFPMLLVSTAWSAVLPLAYPLALLIVMNTQTVKAYYASLEV